jgi:hypothetical protein
MILSDPALLEIISSLFFCNSASIASAGVSGSVSFAVEDTTAKTTTVKCEVGYSCCLAVIEKRVRVKGTRERYITAGSSSACDPGSQIGETEEFEFEAPKTVGDGSAELLFFPCISEDSANQVETDTLKKCPPE